MEIYSAGEARGVEAHFVISCLLLSLDKSRTLLAECVEDCQESHANDWAPGGNPESNQNASLMPAFAMNERLLPISTVLSLLTSLSDHSYWRST